MLTIEMRDGKLLKMWNGVNFTEYDSTDLISELNSYLNNGWKLISIENGIYSLKVDELQLMYLDYECFNESINEYKYYTKVITQAEAYLIRSYYNSEVEDEDGNIYSLDEGLFEMTDLRFVTEDKINYLKSRDYTNMVDLLELIKKDMSCA